MCLGDSCVPATAGCMVVRIVDRGEMDHNVCLFRPKGNNAMYDSKVNVDF